MQRILSKMTHSNDGEKMITITLRKVMINGTTTYEVYCDDELDVMHDTLHEGNVAFARTCRNYFHEMF